MPVNLQTPLLNTRLTEGVYLSDGENLYCIMGWSKSGVIVEDCRTGDTCWKHVRKIEEMEVITPKC